MSVVIRCNLLSRSVIYGLQLDGCGLCVQQTESFAIRKNNNRQSSGKPCVGMGMRERERERELDVAHKSSARKAD